MIIENFKPFFGKHCEATAIGNLLQHGGLTLSEPMFLASGRDSVSFTGTVSRWGSRFWAEGAERML